VPSWKVTPWRRVNVQLLPERVHLVASAGRASPAASSFTSVSAVDHRDSMNASSASGDSPERGGCIIATRMRLPPSPPASDDPVKHPETSSMDAAASAEAGSRRRAGRRTEPSGGGDG